MLTTGLRRLRIGADAAVVRTRSELTPAVALWSAWMVKQAGTSVN
jgi:hypothetical protein